MKKRGGREVSLKAALIRRVLLFMLPLAVLLVASNLFAIHVITRQATASYRSTLEVYVDNIDDLFARLDQVLYRLYAVDGNADVAGGTKDPNRLHLAVQGIGIQLKEALANHSGAEGFFVYLPGHDIAVSKTTTAAGGLRQADLNDYARGQYAQLYAQAGRQAMPWQPVQLNGRWYFMRMIADSSAAVGACVSAENLLDDLDATVRGSLDYVYFTDAGGAPLHGGLPVGGRGWLNITATPVHGEYRLQALIRHESILAGLGTVQVPLTRAALLSLLLIPVLVGFLRRSVVRPISTLATAMQDMGAGRLDTRITEKAPYTEFEVATTGFNAMADQIEQLKIDVYEQQLDKQKAQLRFLQLQASPHFYVNSLNVIYSLALVGDTELLKKTVLSLAAYSRYTLSADEAPVRLADELGHIQNYVDIQKQRLAYELRFSLEVAPGLGDVRIPPLTIQGFVENAMKHGIYYDSTIDISVRAEPARRGGRPFLRVTVQDGGKGFDEAVLGQLRRGASIVDGRGERHYGLQNIVQRMRLIYGRDDLVELANAEPHGARATVWIPLEEEGEAPCGC